MAHKNRHKPRPRGSATGSPALTTALEVDLPSPQPGVYLALDEQVSGATGAYASHTEVLLVHHAA